MSRLRRPLNRDAVVAADDEFYRQHPELVRDNGTRIPLDPDDTAQANLRSEWRRLYLANGGELEEDEYDDEDEVDNPVQT